MNKVTSKLMNSLYADISAENILIIPILIRILTLPDMNRIDANFQDHTKYLSISFIDRSFQNNIMLTNIM